MPLVHTPERANSITVFALKIVPQCRIQALRPLTDFHFASENISRIVFTRNACQCAKMVFWFPPDLQETAKLVNWLAKIGSRCCDLEAVLESLNCGIKLKDKKHKHSSGPRRHTRDGYVNVVAYDSVILRVIVEEAEANAKKDLNAFRRAKEALRREYAVDETRGSKDFLCFAEEVWGARGEVRRDLSWDYERL